MNKTIAQRIVEGIADDRDVEPTELDLVLADHINPEVLKQLDNDQASTWTFSFELPEKTVTVMSDGTILLDDKTGDNWLTL